MVPLRSSVQKSEYLKEIRGSVTLGIFYLRDY